MAPKLIAQQVQADRVLRITGRTAERISRGEPGDNYIYQRSYFAYRKACELISGKVLEIGTGTGYALNELAARADLLITVDKHALCRTPPPNVVFMRTQAPPLLNVPDASMDHVVSFQVIEHIPDDRYFLNEVRRVLKPGGRAILTSPNAKRSLTRNPFHVREYEVSEWDNLMRVYFTVEQRLGVFGSPAVETYIHENSRAVERLRRFDVFGLEHRAPSWLLRWAYSTLDRWDRQYLEGKLNGASSAIGANDFHLTEVSEDCLDLFYILRKEA
ncbi:MAG: class I SAM-dependent methyltransferase [Flavobacteriales bacterium]